MNDQEKANKVSEDLLLSKMGKARIGYDGFRLEVKDKVLPKFEELSQQEQMGWARAVLRIESESILDLYDQGRLETK
jgi:hypothetical protein